ncbi:hypothetical protein AJ80_00250 [Polytolypa hystricis UAMH7299]|uniref:Heterokaryon incompatibility domain-containing protein n=1 Tax=Polytolypa hystricis (strain UAMH7299) TaxID=1447883 RepID=A0A2B7Z314_POLH7|nr:hypothetical protein AJ80_00250 [Polytolypa hystricis UAMH7299]
MESSTTAEPYTYTPLPTPTSIRVLHLDSIPEDQDNDLVHCSLKNIDLNDRPWFHALSYTWGNPYPVNDSFRDDYAHQYAYHDRHDTSKRAIMCDGRVMYVSRNLHDALTSVPRDAWLKRCNRRNPRKKLRASLHWAGMSGNGELVSSLVCAGVDVDVKDEMGRPALSYAAQSGGVEAVRVLVEAGADVGVVDGIGKKAVDYAREAGWEGIVDLLDVVEGEKGPCGSREPLLDGPQAWMWIDQICIDQQNVEERNAQVLIMDEIYQKAQYTLVWLGQEDKYTRTAIEVIEKLDSAQGDFMHSDITPYTKQEPELYDKNEIPYISPEGWRALAAVFLRQYFRRVWVVQENVLSSTILGYCGPHEVPWDAFCRVAQYIYNRQILLGRVTSTAYIDLTNAVAAIESEAAYLVQWRDRLISGDKAATPKQFSLESLVFDTWSFRATDPRDNIFALYGLINRASKNRPGTVQEWQPDYAKSVEEVYALATKQIIRESGELLMLSAAVDQSLKNIKTLPSWVPDYSMSFTNMMCVIFNAAGNLPKLENIIRPDSHWNRLAVPGAKVDSVWQTGNTTRGPNDRAMFFDPRWLELTLLLHAEYHNTGQTRTEALWRTLCGNQSVGSSTPAPAAYGDAFRNMLSKLVCVITQDMAQDLRNPKAAPSLETACERVRDIWSHPPISTLTPEAIQLEFEEPDRNMSGPQHQSLSYLLFKLHCLAETETHPATPTLKQIEELNKSINWPAWTESGKNISLPPDGVDYYHSLRNRYGRRRLFVSNKRYIGLGPASMLEGDEIWVLPGAGAAFVLRREGQEGTFRLVGEAYVHGIMDGEAVEGRKGDMCDIQLL